MARAAAAAVLGALLLPACGEPPIDVSIPARAQGGHVADIAGVLDEQELQQRIEALPGDAPDIVTLTYETEAASCGEAYRAGHELVEQWDADIAVVAVARPGDFTSDDDDRLRCLGVQPRDGRAVPGDLRERIAEELVPPRAAVNDWDGAFAVAVDALAGR